MRYPDVCKAVFLSRPNRFIANVLIDGKPETVHVKNTGRCRELLLPGSTVYLCRSANSARKTRYDLIAVEKRTDKGILLINIDSQIPNDIAEEWLPASGLFSGNAVYRREVLRGDSRLDFYIEDGGRKIFLEVKGCTLERDGVCSFPDAPTERGAKHMRELKNLLSKGFECMVLFIVQMSGMNYLRPNDETDPAFSAALREAADTGVRVMAVECDVAPDELVAKRVIPVRLQEPV